MSRVIIIAASISMIASVTFASNAASENDTTVIAADAQPAALKSTDFSNRWTGAYVGANLSYGMLKDNAPPAGAAANGFIYGGFVGYNIEVMGNFIAGLEANYTRMNLEFDDNSGVKAVDSFSARFRGGYATDKFFAYGLIGAEHATATAPFAPGVTFKDTALMLGAGVDIAVTDKIAVGVEYTRSFFAGFDYPTFPLPVPVDVTIQKVQMRVSLKF